MKHVVRAIACLVGTAPLIGFQATAVHRVIVATNTAASGGLGVWQRNAASGAFERSWQSAPRHTSLGSAEPLIVDIDHDGLNDVAFPKGKKDAQYTKGLVVTDVDGDGVLDVLTQRDAITPKRRMIEQWRLTSTGLQLVWQREFDGESTSLLFADVDNDGRQELVTASAAIDILKRSKTTGWELAAELPNIGLPTASSGAQDFTLIDVLRVGDVDGDGRNEIVASGNSGVVTVYQHRRQDTGSDSYPVLWQSSRLNADDLTPRAGVPGTMPLVYTQGLEVADLDGDGRPEILVATLESGIRKGESRPTSGGQVRIFTYDGRRGFTPTWISDRTISASIPAIAVGDLDGDGRPEFVYHGQLVFSRTAAGGFASMPLCAACTGNSNAAIGDLPELREPVAAVRLVPEAPASRAVLRAGEKTDVVFSLSSVWAQANDVNVVVTSDDPRVKIKDGRFHIATIAGRATVALPACAMTVARPPSGGWPDAERGIYAGSIAVRLDITASGGYRQRVQLTLEVPEE